jgi:hypothetical protein
MRQQALFILLILLLIGCASQSPEIFLGDTTCLPPCWYGLFPGKTTLEESQVILKSLPFVSSMSIETIVLQGVTSTRWSFMEGAVGNGILIFNKEGRIQEIRLGTTGLHLGMVTDAFGVPEAIWGDYFPGDVAHYDVSLYYLTLGITVTTHDRPSDVSEMGKERLTRELQVSQIRFYTPMLIEEFLTEIENRSPDNVSYILAHLQPWPGFGEGVVHIER